MQLVSDRVGTRPSLALGFISPLTLLTVSYVWPHPSLSSWGSQCGQGREATALPILGSGWYQVQPRSEPWPTPLPRPRAPQGPPTYRLGAPFLVSGVGRVPKPREEGSHCDPWWGSPGKPRGRRASLIQGPSVRRSRRSSTCHCLTQRSWKRSFPLRVGGTRGGRCVSVQRTWAGGGLPKRSL